MLITTSENLLDYCENLQFPEGEPCIALDTEFWREKTYWPQLCLIQIYDGTRAVAVDPMNMDLSPLFKVLQNPHITKIFHAARQDLEIFYKATGSLPINLVDTQIAAMVCGYGESVSYENLVGDLLKKKLDKSCRYSDWRHRPLSESQLAYALDDVIYLRQIYLKLKPRLSERKEWIAEEHAKLLDPSIYTVDPEKAWERFKVKSASRRMLAFLKELAATREKYAQDNDVPRSRLLKDDFLLKIAASPPKNINDFRFIDETPRALRPFLQEALDRARALPQEECPPAASAPAKAHLPESTLQLCLLLLKRAAENHHVAERLLASPDDIRSFFKNSKESPLMEGWRYTLFGKDLLALKEGTLSLSLGKDSKIQVHVMGSHGETRDTVAEEPPKGRP